MSYFSRPQGLQPTRLLLPWDFPGKSTGLGCHCLLRRRMEATQTTMSERPLTGGYHLGSSVDSAAKLGCRRRPGTRAALPITPRRSLLCHQGAERTQVCDFRRLFCQAPCRRLNLSLVLHVLLQVNGGKMRRRECLEFGHLPFLQLFYFLLLL